MKGQLQYDFVCVDVYNTNKMDEKPIKKTYKGVTHFIDAIEMAVADFPDAYKISVYDGDAKFVGNHFN